MTRRLWFSLIGVVLIVVGALIGNLATGNTPILGLDLQGGVSVILAPVEPASSDDLIVIRDLIRNELESRGIAEPDVRVQGETIVVDLPGVRDQREALDAVDVSGVVELRPVLNFSECPAPDTTDSVPSDSVPETTSTSNELLPTREGAVLCVGPTQGTGEVFVRGSADLTSDGGWGVAVGLRGDGQETWNNLANQCYEMTPTCPSTQPNTRGQIAIVLDSVIQSSPQVNQPDFGDSVAITGSFSRGEAEDLAAVLNRGAFPVEVEAQEARTVSASAGSDSLQAAIIAGLIGVALVLVFLIAFYRWLALVIVGGLTIWAMMVFSLAAFVSSWTNYALSLAGVTGIIVAVGVTVDSYVVFFERIKDELRHGRTIRNAAPRSFKMTWRTIWSADLISIIGATILFWLSVGSVRGFALYLGLTTICDLLVCYFFTRPAVLLLARSKLMARREKALGVKVATA
ncbi:MAG: protein translocase subunit SecD [Actinobacteria bacterium]|nr:MAG: protein translocase subunit SecD [Actinomycetota bacterium]